MTTLRSPRTVVALCCLLFALAYGQSPLFSANQNTYFLHGLADAGVGFLRDDLIAQSPDPFPVFSRLVELTHRHASDGLFHAYYLLVLALYAAACASIADRTLALRDTRLGSTIFFALFAAVHAVPLQRAAWFLQAGMAGQYVLGPVLQPSVFGVLLIVSIERFLRGRVYAAVACGAVAATIHPSYVIGALALTGAYAYRIVAVERRRGKATLVIALSGALLLPVVLHTWSAFAPTSMEITRRAQEILVHERFPHHALPGRWFGLTEAAQIIIVCAGMFLARGTPLMPVLLIPTVIGLILTLGQILLQSDGLALLFPWRVSVFLVPLSSTLLLGAAVRHIHIRCGTSLARRERLIRTTACGALVALAVFGVTHSLIPGTARSADRRGVTEFVRTTLARGELYLIPPRWEDFRLRTGAPIYVDFKTHPYRDTDVVAWYDRLKSAEAFYRSDDGARLTELTRLGVTHVVTRIGSAAIAAVGGVELFCDDGYCVYRVSDPDRASPASVPIPNPTPQPRRE